MVAQNEWPKMSIKYSKFSKSTVFLLVNFFLLITILEIQHFNKNDTRNLTKW